MTDSNKHQLYSNLVRLRKHCKLCCGLVNPWVCGNGQYDSSQIGPWSRWQGNLQAKLMVVGQDWGDVDYFLKWKGFDDPNNPTNVNLRKLLASIKVDIEPFEGIDQVGEIFLTNTILCLKQNSMQGKVDKKWYENCGKEFLRPLIEIVKPNVIVAIGEEGPYKTILQVYGIRYVKPKAYWMEVERVGQAGGRKLSNGILLFPVYHCGKRGVNKNRLWLKQLNDWKPIRKAMQAQ